MIRFATEKDLSAMLEIYRPYVENTTYSFEYEVPSMADFTRRFRDHVAQFPWLVWEEEGTVLGYAYAGAPWERAAYRWCAEVSIYLHPSVHGRGIGRQLYALLEEILTRQGYRVCYALITTENRGSVAFHEKLGYTYHSTFENCGYKMGRWLGVIWLQKWLNPLDNPDEFPKNWKNVV
jgi:phosphinothricin acetyltransferase